MALGRRGDPHREPRSNVKIRTALQLNLLKKNNLKKLQIDPYILIIGYVLWIQ